MNRSTLSRVLVTIAVLGTIVEVVLEHGDPSSETHELVNSRRSGAWAG